ncbi:MAG: TIR domain-containing protein [Candidatus Rokuibacteriota bacterium]
MSSDERSPTPSQELRYDAFISYSRKDKEFARRLEQELRRYRPPRDLAVPQRYLRVFRDEADFSGPEYQESLVRNLKDASKLIVICSPNAASSPYVADEIRHFSEQRGKEHIVPLLLDGIPNNEARAEDDARRAFPEQLVRVLPTPLAADYRGFDPRAHSVCKGDYAPAWFKTLADLYADHGVDRAKVEQRERRREARRLRIIAAVSSAVALALLGLTTWALLSRSEARRQRDNAEARRTEAEARLVFDDGSGDLLKATLLSIASVRFALTVDGQILLTRFLGLLPRPPAWRRSVPSRNLSGLGGHQRVLAFSPDGVRIAYADGHGRVQLLDAQTGEPVRSLEGDRQAASLTFSPNGAFLVLGCGHEACVLDVASGQLITRLPGPRWNSTVWSVFFSPDGKLLAVASYGSNEVLVYDVPTWRPAATIRSGGSTAVYYVAFSRAGDWLATVDPGGVKLWQVGRYAAPAAAVNTSGVMSIAFQPDDRGFVAASGHKLQSWRIVSDGGALRLEAGASTPIGAHTLLAVSWRNSACLGAATRAAVRVLCGEPLSEVLRVPVSSAAVASSPDGGWLVNEQMDGILAAWELQSGLDAFPVRVGAPVRSLTSADRGGWLAAGTDSGEVVVVGLDTRKELSRLRLPAPVGTVNASAGGQWLAVAAGASLHVFDARNWREAVSRTYGHAVAWAGFDAADRWLVIATDTAIVLLRTRDWRERVRLEYDGELEALRFSPDASKLAAVTRWRPGHDEGVHLTRVLDLASGKEIGWEYVSGNSNLSAAFMKDEAGRKKRTLVGGDTVSVRASASSWQTLELREPDASADGRWTVRVSGSVMELRDAATNRVIGGLDHGDRITGVRFVPAAAPRWLVSAGVDGTLGIWPIRAEDLADEACARLRAMLSAEALTKLVAETHTERSCGES